jgi:hypothetical protein
MILNSGIWILFRSDEEGPPPVSLEISPVTRLYGKSGTIQRLAINLFIKWANFIVNWRIDLI